MVETYGTHESRVYFVEEVNYGETPATPAMLGINTQHVEPLLDPQLIKVRGIGSRDLQSISKGLRRVTLKISDCLSSESPISFIQHAQTLNSLSIQVLYYKGLWVSAADIISFLYTGCRIDKLSMRCSIEDVIKGTVDVIGKDVALGTAKIAGATYGDYAGAVPYHESFVKKGDADGGNLVAVSTVSDWKFNVENNLKPVGVIRNSNGDLLKYLRERHRNIFGDLLLEFESKTEFDDVINDSEFSLSFGLGSTHTALFKYCKWQNVATPGTLEDLVSLKAPFVARDLFIS